MDTTRLRKLAGMDTAVHEALDASIKELDALLAEEIHVGQNMSIDTDTETLGDLLRRLNAAERGLNITLRIKNKDERYKHQKRIANNLRLIVQTLDSITDGHVSKMRDTEIKDVDGARAAQEMGR